MTRSTALFAALIAAFAATPSASALEIHADTVLTDVVIGQPIDVYGTARLTIATPDVGDAFADINLHDSAALDVESGKIFGQISLYGNSALSIRGGTLKGGIFDLFGGSTSIDVTGGAIPYVMKFDRGGSQEIQISGWRSLASPKIIGSGGASLSYRVYDQPSYSGNELNATLRGRDFVQPDVNKSLTVINVDWELFADAPHPADVNLDGAIDIADLNDVRNNFGNAGPAGDSLPYNGTVDIADLNSVRNYFGHSATAVPEPSGIAIAGILAGFLIATARRRTSRS